MISWLHLLRFGSFDHLYVTELRKGKMILVCSQCGEVHQPLPKQRYKERKVKQAKVLKIAERKRA